MSEFAANFHFLRPWVLLLLLLPILLYGMWFHGVTAQSSWQKVIDKKLLDYLLVKGSAAKRKFLVNLSFLGLIIGIIAAAGPSWNKIEIPAYAPENPLMITLSLSSDMNKTDLTPSRLARAKYKITDLLSKLEGVQAGLEVYSVEPFVISPLTDDMNILQNLLPAINFDIMPANGDRLDRAIELAANKIKDAGYAKGNILVFASDVGQNFDLALSQAKKAAELGFKVDIIGVAAEENEKLAMVASYGGGKYWQIQSGDSKLDAYALSLNSNKGDLEKSKNLRQVWLDAGYMLLFIPLLCCLLFFRKGILVIAFMLFSFSAEAGFFLNADQEGLKAFNRGDYQKAQSSFKDNNWKAASYYRGGNYEAAYKEYAKDNSITGLYNQGNALAKSGKIEEAIKKYEEVLSQDAEHEDAKFNLEYLKKQQQQQKQNQQQENQDNKQDKQDKNQQSQQQQGANDNNQDDRQSGDKNNQQQSSQENNGDKNSQEQQQQDNAAPQSQGEQDKNSQNQEPNADKERQTASQSELDETKQQNEGKEESASMSKEGEKDEEYDEKMQAKARRYREIPEDPGGLLKAFIYNEYRQNRYQSNG